MPIPYNLKVTQEEKIYEKMIHESDVSDVHIAPHTLRVAAMFTVSDAIKGTEKRRYRFSEKMRLYDGENVEGFNSADINELKKEYQDEGMSGIDPRYVINRISSTIIRKENPID